ncbi:HlyD family type I secretion periplasmic adaptor subunit [Maritimibacter fusiformis]|uniref:Membrane fusion protein (MFP) family protein n=1 Tax=Maritimibacter fusiformis TaxID=2603819 RepID=A0A5D0RMV2_9RHOB|nr:HlyD family type I secretion periplasmic adaptor subunit [Maritimibacter fusiformis]TYB82011.1 HlyD family type I secretion periplasmic adaptor subunit [Maritimibacter fusiformis]
MSAPTPQPAWSARRPLILGLVAILVLVCGFGTWATTTRISGAIVAPGAIEVEQNRQVVQHLDGGVVASIEVHEGDRVRKGQVLIRLDAEDVASELTIVESQLFELMARRGRLEAERDEARDISFAPELLSLAETNPDVAAMLEGNRRLFRQRRDNLWSSVEQLEKRAAQIASQIGGIAAQREALEEQARLIAEELVSQQALLEKGLTQASQVLALRREQARLVGTLGEVTATGAQAEGRITEIEIEITRIEAQRREDASEDLSTLEGRELELAERRRALRQQLDRLVIRAPVSGAVHAMQVFGEDAVIRPAEPVLFIVPQDRPLIIGVRVAPIHVDQIHIGQPVILRFSAFSSRATPELTGTVLSVSPDALTDDATGQRFYRARIEIAEGEADKLPEGTVLIPGMPVEAYLRTGDRSPIAYLVKPLADYFNKALRED